MLQISLAGGINAQAAPEGSLRINQLYEVNKDRQGVFVEIYTNGEGTYQAIIKSDARAAVSMHPEISYPPPRTSWLSFDLLKIDFGSELGADVRSFFYSIRRNEVKGPFPFVKAVEPKNEIALCAGGDAYLQKIFEEGNIKAPLKLAHLSTAALKWFVISEAHFTGNMLHIRYMTDSSDNGGEEEWASVETEIPSVLLRGTQPAEISENRWVMVEGGSWVPGAETVSRLKERTEPFVRAQAKTEGRKLREWKTYTFQYQGREENGKRIVFVNAFCFTDNLWQLNKQMVLVFDGGACFFNFRYDAEKDRLFSLFINGEA